MELSQNEYPNSKKSKIESWIDRLLTKDIVNPLIIVNWDINMWFSKWLVQWLNYSKSIVILDFKDSD